MTDITIDDASVRWAIDGRAASASEAIRLLATRPLLLLMHGYGSHAGDLLSLTPHLPPRFVAAALQAPLALPNPMGQAFAWWPLQFGLDGTVVREAPPAQFEGSTPHAAAVAVLEWLDALEAKVDASGIRTIVPIGFSQGGCMVTSLMRLRPARFASGVVCSGFVAPGASLGDAELAAIRPPLFWGRDPLDPIIDAERIAQMSEWAPRHTTLEARLYDGIFHGIGLDELNDISGFLEATA